MTNGQSETDPRSSEGDILVMRANSDKNAFILLYDIYYEKIFRHCLNRLKSRQISEDTTSTVFIWAAANIRRFKGKTRKDFFDWLYSIATKQINLYSGKKQFEIIKKLDVEEIPENTGHKERLRTKVLSAFDTSYAITVRKILYLSAAAIVLIAIGIFLNFPMRKPAAPAVMKPQLKPAADANSIRPPKTIKLPTVTKEVNTTPPEAAIAPEEEPVEIQPKTESSEIVKNEQAEPTEGIAVTGRVVNSEAKPLQATVIKGSFRESQKSVICDANGWFRFSNVELGVEVFTAQCKGASPQLIPAEVKSDMPAIIFTLGPGHTISGKIVDANNMPIENASVSVSLWQGAGSLNFETKTVADGFFEWNDSPADEVLFNIQKKGFVSIRNFGMQSGTDYIIPLAPALKIRGSVTSSDPCEPVETFIITPGYYFEKGKISWQDADSVIFSGDKYELAVTEPFDFQLKIQANDFESAESPVFSPQNAGEYNFVLKSEP